MMINDFIANDDISGALSALDQKTRELPGKGFSDRLDSLRSEYTYMSNFMLQGYKDDKRGQLFADFLARLGYLDYDICVADTVAKNTYLNAMAKSLAAVDTSAEALQNDLRAATDDAQHYERLQKAFDALVTSSHWRDKDVRLWTAFLSDDATDPVDSATLVSALMLSAMLNYSAEKVRCLAEVSCVAMHDETRERAFVAVSLIITCRETRRLATDDDVLRALFGRDEAAKTITEMQIQMEACAKAESDHDEIRKDIMPKIAGGQTFRITKNGIVEREEGLDALDPDATERGMEAMEQSVKRMLDMQKNGSDIFFGGFKQMKRFPFFYKMMNWFMPFTMHHPGIQSELAKLSDSSFVEHVTSRGPFCGSDLYSFVIVLSSIMNQLPENVRKMMNEGGLGPLGMMPEGEAKRSASLVRLHYLQDMYRFFRLSPMANMVANPFDMIHHYRLWCFAAERMSVAERKTVCRYMMRNARSEELYDDVEAMMELDSQHDTEERLSVMAELRMRQKRYDEAARLYQQLINRDGDNVQYLRGAARAFYALGRYEQSWAYFDSLHTLQPTRLSFAMDYLMAGTLCGKAEQMVNEAYKLEYENGDNMDVRNTLGWVLLCAGKADKALAEYERMAAADALKSNYSYTVNAFYARMIGGQMTQAMDLLKAYSATLQGDERRNLAEKLSTTMREDAYMLSMYNIGQAERCIIVTQMSIFLS